MCGNSFSEFVGRAAQRQPLLLVLEDLHWAGESTLLLTEYLAPLLPDMPALVLGTYRDDEVDLHHRLARGHWPAGAPPFGGTGQPAPADVQWRSRDAAGAGRAAGA
jgi:hypothetical protein